MICVLSLIGSIKMSMAAPTSSSDWHIHGLFGAGYTLAPTRSEAARSELPWRPLESSRFTPLRLDLGLSYRRVADQGISADVGIRLLRRAQYYQSNLSDLYEQHTLSPPQLGELSVSYQFPIKAAPKLIIGRHLTSLQNTTPYHLGEMSNLLLASPSLTEDRRWSRALSPIDQWVNGLSAWGCLGCETEQADNSLALHYLFSIFSPAAEQLDAYPLNRGLGLMGTLSLHMPRWHMRLSAVHARQLRLSRETRSWADHRLETARLVNRFPTLQSRSLQRDANWIQGETRVLLSTFGHMSHWASFGLEERWSHVKELSPLEEAALADANIGPGRTFTTGIMGTSAQSTLSFYPNRYHVRYTARDPDQRFAYDMRHWLDLSLGYTMLSHDWMAIHMELWWSHLWSAGANRWATESDLAGIQLIIIR